jgi:hypothetical protein
MIIGRLDIWVKPHRTPTKKAMPSALIKRLMEQTVVITNRW